MKGKRALLEVKNLTKYYISGYVRTTKIVGAKNVSFALKRGEVLSLVGESGSGKTTVANMILRLLRPTSGKILLDRKDAFSIDKRVYWRRVQAVFQDPFSSFNYMYTVDRPLEDVFNLFERPPPKDKRKRIIRSNMKLIGLNPDEILGRYPHQLSGGQMQRILIARSLILNPDILVADEPTSMIDASTRVAILNELLRLKKRGMSIIFVTHDVGQAYYLSDRAAVMKDGEIVEIGPAKKVFFDPKHQYTKNLVASVPKLHEKWKL